MASNHAVPVQIWLDAPYNMNPKAKLLTDPLSIAAAYVCMSKHGRQLRKFSGEPYWKHPFSVVERMTNFMAEEISTDMVATAFLHDILEDTKTSAVNLFISMTSTLRQHIKIDWQERIEVRRVVALVEELTNPSKQHPDLCRMKRKQMDREHLARVSREAQIIKVFDRVDNLDDFAKHETNRNFLVMYCRESSLLLDRMTKVDERLYDLLSAAITLAYP